MMGAVLHIESDEVVRLAEELAALRGTSVEEVVLDTLRQRIEREQAVQRRVEEIMAAAAAFRETLDHPLPTSDHSWLYDENGLPA